MIEPTRPLRITVCFQRETIESHRVLAVRPRPRVSERRALNCSIVHSGPIVGQKLVERARPERDPIEDALSLPPSLLAVPPQPFQIPFFPLFLPFAATLQALQILSFEFL